MSPKLSVISGPDLIRALGKSGYVTVRQKGSQVRLRHPSDPQRLPGACPCNQFRIRWIGFLWPLRGGKSFSPGAILEYCKH